jgi:hypothetical protein
VTGPDQTRRPAAIWALLALLLLQGLGGLGGGISLVLGPEGQIMKMPVSYLEGSPFPDYLVPGLILTLVLGVFPLVALVGLWQRNPWSWYAAFAVGCGLMIWILVEVMIIPFDPLQVIFGVVGALITAVALLAPVRRYCGVTVLGG